MKVRLFAAAAIAAVAAFGATAEAVTLTATEIDAGRSGVAGQGFEATTQVRTNNRKDAGNALGGADQSYWKGGVYSVGKDGVAVFGFGVGVNASEAMLEVAFGASNKKNDWKAHQKADVYTLNGGYTPFDGKFGLADILTAGFEKVGTVTNGWSWKGDSASVKVDSPFTFVALVDASSKWGYGLDVDAVLATFETFDPASVSQVPVPASLPLFASALLGLGYLARKRKNA